MKRYLIRASKYFVAMCVLCAGIMALNQMAGAALNFEQTIYVMFHTPRGMLLPAVVVILALGYPKFGFVARTTAGDITKDRELISNAFRSAGFILDKESDGVLYFRAKSPLHKLLLLGEDEITVAPHGPEEIRIEGIRRGVARVEYRLESYIRMNRYGN